MSYRRLLALAAGIVIPKPLAGRQRATTAGVKVDARDQQWKGNSRIQRIECSGAGKGAGVDEVKRAVIRKGQPRKRRFAGPPAKSTVR